MLRRLKVEVGLFLGMALCSCASTYADTYALLVGVSGYPTFAESRRLRGPANDVQLMRAALIQQGIASNSITTLADGVKGSQALPTRQNILAGMRVLAKQAKAGDWAIVYFSGHGSQQPQPPASKLPAGAYIEPDGLDEIFLPYDVGRWSGGKGHVEGALLDDEIGVELNWMTQRGIRVWAIFDTCHAGDMAKSGGFQSNDGPVNRYVPPATLGIPLHALQATRPTANTNLHSIYKTDVTQKKSTPKLPPLSNAKSADLVVFYASQADEPAAEEPLEVPAILNISAQNQVEGKRYFGLFTYLIAQALPTWSGSFNQLAEQVSAKYKTRPYPTPLFVGNLAIKPKFEQQP